MTLSEKCAYIKGLAEGCKPNTDTPEGKMIMALLDLTTEMAERIQDLEEDDCYTQDYLDELDYDLGTVERYLQDETDDFEVGMYDDELDGEEDDEYEDYEDEDYEDYDEFEDDEDDDDEDEDEDDCDGDCDGCAMHDICFDEDDEDFDGEEEEEDEEFEYYEIECPSCGEVISIDSEMPIENLICPACGEKFACIVEEDDLPDGEDEDGEDDNKDE